MKKSLEDYLIIKQRPKFCNGFLLGRFHFEIVILSTVDALFWCGCIRNYLRSTTKLAKTVYSIQKKNTDFKLNYSNTKSSSFSEFTGFTKHTSHSNTASIKLKITTLKWRLRFNNSFRKFVFCSILKWSSSNFLSNMVKQFDWTSATLDSVFGIWIMPFLQTRPEVCCDLKYFVVLNEFL